MPKLPTDYSKTIIYKIVHKEDYDNANIYIGSTSNFVKRKNQHKSDCNCVTSKSYNQKNYQYIRDNGGWDCFNMIEVEKFSCNDGNEARAREEYWRCFFNAQLNSFRAYITDEQIREIKKERYEQNKDKRLEQMKEYRESNKDKISEQKKEHYEQNKHKILEQKKQYYYNKKNNLTDNLTECITHQSL